MRDDDLPPARWWAPGGPSAFGAGPASRARRPPKRAAAARRPRPAPFASTVASAIDTWSAAAARVPLGPAFASLGSSLPWLRKQGKQGLGAHFGGGGGGGRGADERVLVSEVVLTGVADPAVERAARDALAMKPNFAYTLEEVRRRGGGWGGRVGEGGGGGGGGTNRDHPRPPAPPPHAQVQDDMRRVFDTGYFTSVAPTAEDTRDGVRLTIALTPYPTLRGAVVTGADALPVRVLEDAFRGMVRGGRGGEGAFWGGRRRNRPRDPHAPLFLSRPAARSTTATLRRRWRRSPPGTAPRACPGL